MFEAFHDLGGVLRYGIPEFRLPNTLIDDVVRKIRLLGGRFVTNFVVGKTATLEDLKDNGFWRIFVGTGAGLPRFMNVPGEHLLGVMSANEFLTRINLMQARLEDYDTPLPEVKDKNIIVIGGGNTAMDAARTAKRLGGIVTIVYRRTQAEMPARVEELHHALEEGIALKVLRSPRAFESEKSAHVCHTVLDVMELGPPDASGRRAPVATGKTETMPVDLVVMALGNASNPIIKNSEPDLKTSKWGTITVDGRSQKTSLEGVYSGGDATRGGATAVLAAGDGQAAAREIVGDIPFSKTEIEGMVEKASRYTDLALSPQTILKKVNLAEGIVEIRVRSPMIAKSAQAGQFVRVLPTPKGELIPLTLSDWDPKAGTIDLVIQAVGASSIGINAMEVGEAFTGIAGPLGQPSKLHRYEGDQTVVFCAGGLGLPPVYPILRNHLKLGNHATLISGFRTAGALFWTGEGERVDVLQKEFGDQLRVIYATNDGTFGVKGFVTTPARGAFEGERRGQGPQGRGSDRHRAAVDDARGERPDQALRRADGREPQRHHGGRHRHVRRLHGPGDDRGQDGAQACLHRRAGTRLAHHRLGQVPAALPAVQGAGKGEHGEARARLRRTRRPKPLETRRVVRRAFSGAGGKTAISPPSFHTVVIQKVDTSPRRSEGAPFDRRRVRVRCGRGPCTFTISKC